MFSGFRSRCSTPSPCAASIAPQTADRIARRARRLEPSFAMQHAPQILAAHQLHHEIGAAARERAEVEDRDDAGMLEPRRRSALRA
jgi:hypothetical protein